MENIPLPPSSPMTGAIEMLPKTVIAEEVGRTKRTVSSHDRVLNNFALSNSDAGFRYPKNRKID